MLRELRQLGVSLSIDDFGTGYSSLSYLRQLPVQTLKIDQSLVQGLPDHEHETSISLAIISLAKTLRLDLVAEGVKPRPSAASCWTPAASTARAIFMPGRCRRTNWPS